MDKNAVMNSVSAYADEVSKRFNPKEIILFGSVAKGTASEDSDIDIAVVFDRMNEGYLQTAKVLCKLCREVDINIEPVLLEEGDDPSGFLNEVRKTGRVIYSRQ